MQRDILCEAFQADEAGMRKPAAAGSWTSSRMVTSSGTREPVMVPSLKAEAAVTATEITVNSE